MITYKKDIKIILQIIKTKEKNKKAHPKYNQKISKVYPKYI